MDLVLELFVFRLLISKFYLVVCFHWRGNNLELVVIDMVKETRNTTQTPIQEIKKQSKATRINQTTNEG
jgi:hypothetical protein